MLEVVLFFFRRTFRGRFEVWCDTSRKKHLIEDNDSKKSNINIHDISIVLCNACFAIRFLPRKIQKVGRYVSHPARSILIRRETNLARFICSFYIKISIFQVQRHLPSWYTTSSVGAKRTLPMSHREFFSKIEKSTGTYLHLFTRSVIKCVNYRVINSKIVVAVKKDVYTAGNRSNEITVHGRYNKHLFSII